MRTCLLPALVFLASSPALAQLPQPAHGFTFGLKGGASLTSLTNRDVESSRYLWGFHAGVTGQLALTERFALQAEALYSQKGVRDDIVAGGTHFENRQRLHYLDVPVLARLRAGDAFLEAGPQVGVLLTARAHYELTMGDANPIVTDYFHRVDLGYVAGIGYQLPGGPGLGLRYNGGLLNAVRYGSSGSAIRNSAFQGYVSYQFK